MRKRRLFIGMLLLAMAALIWATDTTMVMHQGNLNLSPAAHQRGDLVVFSGNVDVPAGARIDGSLVVLCCNVIMDGAVVGDLHLVSGNLRLGPEAVLGGAIKTASVNAQVDPHAIVEGRPAGLGLLVTLFRAIALVPSLFLAGLLVLAGGWWRARRQRQAQPVGAGV